MNVLNNFLIAQQAVARMYSFESLKIPYQETVIMNKYHSRIYETSCFAIVQQAVARFVYTVGQATRQQLVAQKVCS